MRQQVNAQPSPAIPAAPRNLLPAPALATGATLVAATLLAVFFLPHGPREAGLARGSVETQRLLRFADRQDGAVIATDPANGTVAAVITGQNGFLRGTLSGLARIRQTEGIGADPPFKLTLYANHRLLLEDPTTARAVELEAFGPTNEAVFAALLRP